ncbi:MAG: hypothetical protein ACJA0H_000859 [Francisellaceae bacterium]|jgi:hypothetical protein
MIRHIVLLKFKSKNENENLKFLQKIILPLKNIFSGILDIQVGTYSSPEGLNKDYNQGFTMDFKSASDRDEYLPHPQHQEVAKKLIEKLDGGVNGVIAFDFEI